METGSGMAAGVNLDHLNAAQLEAVTTTTGPVLVIAGAGSGKTRTLVYRVAHLIAEGVPPEKILLLTFTRKASQEMLWRAGRLLDETCNRVVGGTFHSVANLLLRRYAATLGYPSSFTIIDRADAEGIVNLLKSSLGLGKKEKRFPSRRVLVNMISGSVNRSIPLVDLVEAQYSHLLDHLDEICSLERHYHEFKFDHGLMDYDDLLVNWKRLLAESEDARRAIAGRFSHIMVDEYQDTNLIQAEIVRLTAFGHDNVMVVGDDSQSIYSFRGADFYNIMRFPKIFADTRVIKLEENYRSTQPILTLTNELIDKAEEKYTKTLFTRIAGELRPMLFAGRDDREEAAFVVATVKRLLAEGQEPQEIAVLFRSGFHSYKLELELAAAGLVYEKRGGLKLTESAHMKDMIAFFRLLCNPFDGLSWNRVFLQLEKVGPATAQKIAATVAAHPEPIRALAEYPAGKSWRESFAGLVRLFTDLDPEQQRPVELYARVRDYYQPVFERLYHDDYPKREKDLDQLPGIMAGYRHLQEFIDDTSLDPPEEAGDTAAGLARLVLSTIHSAKGLEFETVFVIGLAEGRFPHPAAEFGPGWEEERRLLYVAATRARKNLYLTYPRQLLTPDRQFRWVGLSPYLAELRPGLFVRVDGPDGEEQIRPVRPPPLAVPPTAGPGRHQRQELSDFVVGSRVSHPFFGNGVVTKLVGGRSLDVHFDRHGLRTLHLDYARLARI